ncbi:hypothetical protein [Desulfocastanea catecholica]
MANESFTKKVLDATLAAASVNGGRAYAVDVSKLLFIQTRREHKRVLNSLSELSRSGRLGRISQGIYGPPPPTGTARQVDKREVMWRLLRMRKRVTVEDLMELAGVSKHYAKEWLLMLVNRRVVSKVQQPGQKGVWLLLADQVEMPVDVEKADRLRKIRVEKKKEIAARLDTIGEALDDVRELLQTMEDLQ